MGILTSLLKLPFTLGKKTIGTIFPPDNSVPIVAVAQTKYPSVYEDYYSTLGYTTDRYKGRLIVWDKNVSEKKKLKTLEELQKVV